VREHIARLNHKGIRRASRTSSLIFAAAIGPQYATRGRTARCLMG
jgi:hypothetical protein